VHPKTAMPIVQLCGCRIILGQLEWPNITWSFTFSCTVSVFWSHHFMSRSGRQRDICCLVIFCQQLTTNVFQSCHPHSPKYCYHPYPDISLFLITLAEHQNMIYMKLQTVNLPATFNSTRSHVAKGLADNLIKRNGGGEISRLQFVCKVSYRYKTVWHVRNVPSKLLGRAVWHGSAQCEMVPLSVKWSRAVWNGPTQLYFLLKSLLEAAVFLVVLNFIVRFK
jgi:hypothetical protein